MEKVAGVTGKFWMVWCPAQRPPTYCHPTKKAANAEAKRLANSNPSLTYIVLEAVSGFCAEIQPAAKVDLDKMSVTNDVIPF